MALHIGQIRFCARGFLRQQKRCNGLDIFRFYSASGQPKADTTKETILPPPSSVPDIKSNAHLSSSGPGSQDARFESAPPPQRPALTSLLMRKNMRGYVFTRYIDYVKNYDKVLEKKFPSAMKVYRVFFDGVKDFYADMKRYLKIIRVINESSKGIRALNRKELELYVQMRRDMIRVAPALIGSSLPMVGYAIFPIVFMYPRTLLTSHFWNLQQRSEFAQINLQERLYCNRPIFRCMQAKLDSVHDHEKSAELSTTLGLLGSGFHPTVDMILDIKDVFAKPPYNLLSLSGKHIKLLCQMHGVTKGWFKRHRLVEYAFLVHYMDRAILQEGGAHNMQPEAIRHSCYIRGLNPTNLSNEEMINWLRDWIHVSITIREEHISLFLHLPLFMAYNHPNNWRLIYERKPSRI